MVRTPAFIGIDWGTSNARFLLVDTAGGVIEQRSGPGIGQISGSEHIEKICFDNIGLWLTETPHLPVIMVGMVGSNIGWRLTEYVQTPAKLSDIQSGIVQFQARGYDILIAPGLSTRRSDGLPDLMRGEEMQIFGASKGVESLFCLPGTHSKWAVYSDGAITGFHTSLTGELLDLIGRNSILLGSKRTVRAQVDDSFRQGVMVSKDSTIGIESLLFSVRSRQIAGELDDTHAESYLAGLVIGCEIRSAMLLHGSQKIVTLVGAPELTGLYAASLDYFDVRSEQVSGDMASLSGLYKLYKGMR